MVKLVSKMGLEYYDRENWTTLTFRTLCSFEEFCTDTTPKIVFHLLFLLIFREYFVNCKQKAMSNSTDANFLLQAFETRFYIILLLGCLWHTQF